MNRHEKKKIKGAKEAKQGRMRKGEGKKKRAQTGIFLDSEMEQPCKVDRERGVGEKGDEER